MSGHFQVLFGALKDRNLFSCSSNSIPTNDPAGRKRSSTIISGFDAMNCSKKVWILRKFSLEKFEFYHPKLSLWQPYKSNHMLVSQVIRQNSESSNTWRETIKLSKRNFVPVIFIFFNQRNFHERNFSKVKNSQKFTGLTFTYQKCRKLSRMKILKNRSPQFW